MFTVPVLLLASLANAAAVPAAPAVPASPAAPAVPAGHESDTPAPSGTLDDPPSVSLPTAPAPLPLPQQRWHFLTPTVHFTPDDKWDTSNLAAFASGAANASIGAVGTGMNFSTGGDPATLKVYVNGSDAEHFGGKVDIQSLTNNRVSAAVTGLEFGWWEYTLAGSQNLTFRGADAIGQGRFSQGNATALSEAKGVHYEGQWEDGRTNSTGASFTLETPLGTGIVELTSFQPPVPFGAFRVTIDPAPRYGPSTQEFWPNLWPANIQAMIAHGNVPIYSAVLDSRGTHKVKVEYIDDGEPFVAQDVAYHM